MSVGTDLKENTSRAEEGLSDLPVSTEQAEDAKGGPNYGHIEFEYKPQRADRD